jgi:hypothetical protein
MPPLWRHGRAKVFGFMDVLAKVVSENGQEFEMLRFVLGLGVILLLVSCTKKVAVHRNLGPDQAICQSAIDLRSGNTEPIRKKANPARCFLQSHVLPAPNLKQKSNQPDEVPKTWAQTAVSQGRELHQSDAFNLAFVEIADSGDFQRPQQLAALTSHLNAVHRAGVQNYVITFVHGWRHDASLRDDDVRKFRILLGYARAALNTRCVDQGLYCNVSLTGVLVAWRGRSLAEPILIADGKLNPFNLIVAPTIWDRKSQSDKLGDGRDSPLAQVLDAIDAELTLGAGNPQKDKFLIFGHSLGGNMLANLMQERSLTAINDFPMRGAAMSPPLGDLVVLINPASEAEKWTSLQQAMRSKVNLDRADNFLSSTVDGKLDEDLWRRLKPWREMFPMTQRPVYISITATANWHNSERQGRKIAYDSATGVLFPLSRWFTGARTPEDRMAIGHLTPTYRTQKTLFSPARGSTHELSVNESAGKRASYQLSATPTMSRCDPANGWLLAVRRDQQDKQWTYGDAWDYGLSADQADGQLGAAENIARGVNPASVQWRHSLNLSHQRDLWSVVSGRSPFWNVRAFDTAIREHHGWVNYPMWCALNQLVLDDVVKSGPLDDTVEAMIEVRSERNTAEQPGEKQQP